jgi:hypothetical protein
MIVLKINAGMSINSYLIIFICIQIFDKNVVSTKVIIFIN